MVTFDDIMNYSPENQKVFDELLGLCIKGLIVPYVGAGMSAFRFPLWDRYINEKKSCLGDRANEMNNIDAAEAIEKKLGKDVFYKDIQTTFGGCINDTEWNKIKEDAKNEAVSIIPELFHSPIITTNFDQILEKIHNNISVAFPNDIKELEKVKTDRKPLVYKIHGSVSDVQNIIFTKTAYNKVYASDTLLVKSLSDFFTSFHFLFLGCSLAINSKGGTKEHYIELWEKLQQSGMYHFAILDCANDEIIKSERRKELENKNIRIRPILYESGKYESVKIILEELFDKVRNQLFKIPEYNTPFTDRTNSIITKITSILENSKYSVLALTGFGGVGKTRIMSEYAHKIKKETDIKVFWFNAISTENVREQIRQFVVKYQGVSEKETNTNIISQAFTNWTKENENYLFLLDNVENYEDIKMFLNNDFSIQIGTRYILITSRLSEKELNNIQTEEIKVFEKEDARSFLQSHTDADKYDEEYADKIADLLGYLPLALEQAAAFIKAQNKEDTYEKYFEELIKAPFELLEKMHPEPGAVSVAATWNIAMQRINSDAAKELLWICAYFAPDNINDKWFIEAVEVLPKNLKNNIQTQLNEIEEQLKKYSLVKIDSGKISIHRLLQGVIRRTLKNEKKKWVDNCVEIMNKLVYNDFSTNPLRQKFNDIKQHIISIVQSSYYGKDIKFSNLYYFLGRGYYEFAIYNNAYDYFQKALAIQKKILGKEHLEVASTYNNIGRTYGSQCNYKKSLYFLEKSLRIFEKELGINHPTTALLCSNIGFLYSEQSDYDKAHKYNQKALTIRKNTLGTKHPDTAISYCNIGCIYYSQGNYKKALEYYQKSEKVLCKKIIEFGTINNNIGVLYSALGNYKKSLEYFYKDFRIIKKILGKEHPITTIAYNNIGRVYEEQCDYNKALKYFNKALTSQKKIFAKEHSLMASSYNNIASVYTKKENYDKALRYYQEALNIFLKIFGKYHPSTATAYNNIGTIYDTLGNYDEALKYYQIDLSICEKNFGEKHLSTATSYNNIGYIYYEKDDLDAALMYYNKALEIRKNLLGYKHPDVGWSYNNVGYVYLYKNNYEAAFKCFQKSLSIRKKILGEYHSYTADSYNSLGVLYNKKGNYNTAIKYIQKSIDIREKISGKTHTDTAYSYIEMGYSFYGLRQYQKSIKYFQKAFEIREKQLGINHHLTLETQECIYNIQSEMKNIYNKTNSPIPFDKWLKEQMK